MTLRVVSYNILVPIYADRPEYYFSCKPEFLKTDHRWNLIRSELEREILNHENTIICLQELSLPLLPKVELFFRQLNYSLFHQLYGGPHNDYMGVGIAIPVSMKLNSVSYVKIQDRIRSMCKRQVQQANIFTWFGSVYQSVMQKFQSNSTSDPWDVAINRTNTLICINVTVDNKSVNIGTYHMPCVYLIPDVMTIHSSVVKDVMFELANGQDFILVGDFNLQPSSKQYRALTEKNYADCKLPESNQYEVSYQLNNEQILKSAYREKNGVEPVYTDYSDTPGSPKFCATLDYIFFHGQLTIEDVLKLPDQPSGASYPDATHPSDHLMLAATIRLS